MLWNRRTTAALRLVASAPDPAMSLASPWVTGSLEPIVWADIFGADALTPMTRSAALSVPACARARSLLCSSVARSPMHAYRGTEAVVDPPWVSATDGVVSPFIRMLWTVDDLLFTGWALWGVERGADGFPLRMDRVERSRWYIEADPTEPGEARVMVDNAPADPSTCVVIPGPHDGILNFGRRTLTTAAELEQAVANTARSPVPAIDLHQTTDVVLETTEREAMIASWVRARRGENGGVAYTNAAVDARVLGQPVESLIIEGRNASAVDVARLCGVPASLIDATNAGASLTYETTEGRNHEFVDYGTLPYMLAIAGRLSLDDVVPRGQRVAFDLEELTGPAPTATGPTTED